VDAQSVKNTDTAKHKGYDAGKKVSGIRRHITVDTQGFPHAVAVSTAEATDRKDILQALRQDKAQRMSAWIALCALRPSMSRDEFRAKPLLKSAMSL
jgi:hypothetical protein